MSALIRALVEAASSTSEEPAGTRARCTVLVTGVGGPVGAAVARDLAVRGFTVHGADSRPGADAGSIPDLVWHMVPRSEEAGYLPTLHRIVNRHGVSIVIPTLDEELPVMAAVRHWPEAGVVVIVAGSTAVGLAQDKLVMAWQLAGRGVATPRTVSPSDFSDTAAALESLGQAVVVRSRRAGRRAGGARVLFTADDIDWGRLDDDFVVQQFIPGREYVCVLYRPEGAAKRGSVVFESLRPGPAHEEVRPVPPGQADDVGRTAWAAIRALGVTGPAVVVLRRALDGTVMVLSVRPRFGRHCTELLDQLARPEQLPSQRAAGPVEENRATGPRARDRPGVTGHQRSPHVPNG